MKAKLFLLGLCSLALAACSIDETVQVNDTDAVKFKVTAATRAEATTTNNLESFSVWAWNGDELFMDDVVATKSGSSFVTSPLYFWPTGTVDFYALTPSTVTTGVENGVEYAYIGGEFTYTDDEGTGWSYTGNVAKAQIEKDNIVIDTYIPSDSADQIDLCYAVNTGLSSGTVPMNFRHALSQIVFKAMNTNSEMTVDIEGISVCSVYKHGTYTLPTVPTTTNLPTDDLGTGGIADSQGSWDTTEDHKARFVAGITPTTLEGVTDEAVTLTSEGGSLMLLPQEVEAWDPDADATDTELGAYIRISCAVTDNGFQIWPNDNEVDDNGDVLEYAEIAIPVDIAWEEGWRYTYTIIFGDGLGYYTPDDPNDTLDGTPVLVPITFSVSVDEFQEADGIDISTDTGDGGDDEGGYDPASLVLEYTFTSSNTEIELPIASVTNAEIDWGDGSDVETVNSDWPSHTYSEVGTYTVSVSGTVKSLTHYTISGACLTAVIQWGDTGLTSMRYAFDFCQNLTSLPDGPGPFENVTTFWSAFEGCTSLKGVPVEFFDKCTAATDFNYAFRLCSSVEGESPYTEIDVDGTPVKVHLYERADYPEYFATPTSYRQCFQYSSFSDMDDIPSDWKN